MSVTVNVMKKLALLIAVLSLFAAACQTDTTIDVAGADQGAGSQPGDATSTPTGQAETDDTGEDPNSDDPNSDDSTTTDGTSSDDDEPEPTEVPAAEEPTTAPQGDAAATSVPTAEPTSAPVGPAPGAAEAIRAVAEADDWCEAASAVEEGTGALDDLNFSDPVLLEQGLTQALAVITTSKRLVPNAIAGDLDQSIEAFTTLVVALEDVNWSFIDLDLGIIEGLDGPMELATYNIEAYNFNECGIGTDPGLPPVIRDDGTVEGSDDIPEFDGTVREQVVLGLVQGGFSEDEANCIVENLDLANPEALSDPSQLLTVFADCGISLDRLAQLGG